MGEGALRILPLASTLTVAERLTLVPCALDILVLLPAEQTAVFGGVAGRGGEGTRSVGPVFPGLANALPRESLRSKPVPLSC